VTIIAGLANPYAEAKEFNSPKKDQQEVTLAKYNSNIPSTSIKGLQSQLSGSGVKGGQHNPASNKFSTAANKPIRIPWVNPYPRAAKLDAGSNANSAGNRNTPRPGGKFENKLFVPKGKNKNRNSDYRSNYPKNKNKSENQYPIDQPEVNESFKFNSSLKKVTKRALENQNVKREYERLQNIRRCRNCVPGIKKRYENSGKRDEQIV